MTGFLHYGLQRWLPGSQNIRILSRALPDTRAIKFARRDLHRGNIMISSASPPHVLALIDWAMLASTKTTRSTAKLFTPGIWWRVTQCLDTQVFKTAFRIMHGSGIDVQ